MTLLQSGITKSLAEDYTVDQSLRFNDGDSANLTPALLQVKQLNGLLVVG